MGCLTRVCSMSFPWVPEISLLEGLSQNPPSSVPLCLLVGTRKLVARTRWKKSGLHWHLGGSGPTPQVILALCSGVSIPGCVPPCTEQRCSVSQCQRVGVAVPTL